MTEINNNNPPQPDDVDLTGVVLPAYPTPTTEHDLYKEPQQPSDVIRKAYRPIAVFPAGLAAERAVQQGRQAMLSQIARQGGVVAGIASLEQLIAQRINDGLSLEEYRQIRADWPQRAEAGRATEHTSPHELPADAASQLSRGITLEAPMVGPALAIRSVGAAFSKGSYETIAFNASLSTVERASLGRLAFDSTTGAVSFVQPVRKSWQIDALKADPASPNRSHLSLKQKARYLALTAMYGGAAVDVGEAAFGIDTPVPDTLLTLSLSAALMYGVHRATHRRQRPRRLVGGYTDRDLLVQSFEAQSHIADEERGGLRVPNQPITVAISNEQAAEKGIIDTEGKAASLFANRLGLKVDISTDADKPDSLTVKFGELYIDFVRRHPNQSEALDEWNIRYHGQALQTKQAVADYEWHKQELTNQRHVAGVTDYTSPRAETIEAGFAAAELAIVDHALDIVTADEQAVVDKQNAAQRAYFAEQIRDIRTPLPIELENRTVSLEPLRQLIAGAVEPLIQTADAEELQQLLEDTQRYVKQVAVVVKHPDQLVDFWIGYAKQFAGRANVPDWKELAGNQ